MNKTPEQMAAEWYWANVTEQAPVVMLTNPVKHPPCPRKAFLAGYQAAKDEYKVAIDTYNDVAKQMLEEAVRIMSPKDQLADADKVMNPPEKPPCWISVKERLPEYDQLVLLWQSELQAQFVGRRRDSGIVSPLYYWECTSDFFEAWKEIYHPKLMNEEVVTHWMPLPAAPKEEA
jgi:hypothetical protein